MFMDKLKTILDLAIGDGYIPTPRNENSNTHFRMNHSKKQKDYLLYKKEVLDSVGIDSIYREYTDKSGNEICYVITKRYPEITKARELLYLNGKKKITVDLIKMLDVRSLSFIFQDDAGAEIVKNIKDNSIRYVNTFIFNTQSFDLESVNNLSKWLYEYEIENKIYKRKGYFIISIPKFISKLRLVDLIKPFIHESMLYKIDKPLKSTGFGY